MRHISRTLSKPPQSQLKQNFRDTVPLSILCMRRSHIFILRVYPCASQRAYIFFIGFHFILALICLPCPPRLCFTTVDDWLCHVLVNTAPQQKTTGSVLSLNAVLLQKTTCPREYCCTTEDDWLGFSLEIYRAVVFTCRSDQ